MKYLHKIVKKREPEDIFQQKLTCFGTCKRSWLAAESICVSLLCTSLPKQDDGKRLFPKCFGRISQRISHFKRQKVFVFVCAFSKAFSIRPL